MADALNFPLPDSNPDPNFSSQPCDTPAPSSLSHAAAETARALGAASRPAPQQPQQLHPHRQNASAAPVERRRRRRALISAPIRVRSIDLTVTGPDEISTTLDISRNGLLFITSNPYFVRDMDVAVTFPYCKTQGPAQAEQEGRVARVHETPDGRFTVAIALGAGVGEDLVDACGRKLDNDAAHLSYAANHASKKPLILAVDADTLVRDALKNYLSNEGYDVIAVSNGSQAREMLKTFTPALLIAEVEGEDLPGFDLCAHIKTTDTLKHIPVLLTTRSGNPSDYSNAHSLGAVVCMSKPYKHDRMGHVVRLLVPPRHLVAQNFPNARSVYPTRRNLNGNGNSNGNASKSADSPATNGTRRFRFPSFLP
jgi:CheY-like chemotaxis protein